MREYADDLCGERVWGYVVKDEAGQPVSCPSIYRVLGYEQAIRDLAWKPVKSGHEQAIRDLAGPRGNFTFKAALEAAMADPDRRILNFKTKGN